MSQGKKLLENAQVMEDAFIDMSFSLHDPPGLRLTLPPNSLVAIELAEGHDLERGHLWNKGGEGAPNTPTH